jgi:hypothetical protein
MNTMKVDSVATGSGPASGVEEFGTLADMCLSHVPGVHKEITSEASVIYLDRDAKAAKPCEAMDRLSLTLRR